MHLSYNIGMLKKDELMTAVFPCTTLYRLWIHHGSFPSVL